MQISDVHNFYWSCCWLFTWGFPWVEGETNNFSWDFPSFRKSTRAKFCPKFENQVETVPFFKFVSNTKKIPKQFKEFMKQLPLSDLKAAFLAPKTWKKWKTEEFEGKNASQSPQTGKVKKIGRKPWLVSCDLINGCAIFIRFPSPWKLDSGRLSCKVLSLSTFCHWKTGKMPWTEYLYHSFGALH